MKFTEEEYQLLRRHYTVIKIFRWTFWWWTTSPAKVLEHLKELKGCKVCKGKGYHKLSCPNNDKKPIKIGVDIKPKQRR